MHRPTQYKAGFRLAFAALVLALGAAPAKAQTTVFSNFGSGNTFNTRQGWTETGPTSSPVPQNGGQGYYSQGEEFTVSTSGYLSTIIIALRHADGTNDAHLFLADASGGTPGTVLERFTLTDLPTFATAIPFDFAPSPNRPFLTAGSTYFLYESEIGNEFNAWHWNSIGEIGGHVESHNGGSYVTDPNSINPNVKGAFSVQVEPPAAVPEPSTLFAFGCGSVGLVWLMILPKCKKTDVKSST